MGNTAKRKGPWKDARLRFAGLAGAALLLEALPVLYLTLGGRTGRALYFLNLYAALPLCALLLPCWAGLGGVHPLAAFFPIGGLELLLPVYRQPAVGIVCLLLALVSATAGSEWRERKEKRHGRR